MKSFDTLIRKYNTAGPRYTSYPTALQMREVLDPVYFSGKLGASASTDNSISVYIHLPFCKSLCWYCGCNKVISRNPKDANTYLHYLDKDLRISSAFMPKNHVVTQLHLGGGTPTFLSTSQLMQLSLILRQYLNIDPLAECSVEMDPRFLTKSQVQVLRSIGFNRASIGVQDLDPEVQKAIHRIQPLEQNIQVLNWLRESDFDSVNMDLVYGLPFQNLAKFTDTVEKVIEMRPERLAIYNYAHLPDVFPSQRLIPTETLPSTDEKVDMLKMTIEKLTDAGYEHIGMDHFALPDDELAIAKQNGTLQRNFQGYSTQAGKDTWAFGVSAISQVGPAMVQRHKSLVEYYESLDKNIPPISKTYTLTNDDLIRRDVIMRLMCGLSLNWRDIEFRWNIQSIRYFSDEMKRLYNLERDGLLLSNDLGIIITPVGRLFLRNIAMVFDAYLHQSEAKQASSKIL